MAGRAESPEAFATRDQREETKQAGIGGGGRVLAKVSWRPHSVVTCPRGPPRHFRSRAHRALAASDGGEIPQPQRLWRRLRPRGFSRVPAATLIPTAARAGGLTGPGARVAAGSTPPSSSPQLRAGRSFGRQALTRKQDSSLPPCVPPEDPGPSVETDAGSSRARLGIEEVEASPAGPPATCARPSVFSKALAQPASTCQSAPGILTNTLPSVVHAGLEFMAVLPWPQVQGLQASATVSSLNPSCLGGEIVSYLYLPVV
ncbi:uncharacterized protein LOC115070131 [Nannospalax galili]|uniref:uncharacterized protein LOC115070131 n=1 Tax=Nannospalax galili TaxID=1026970 RepID=UPI00111C02E5|nr:uncharacterized protein LOC115070131 [Nannospalax galili]